MAAARKDGAAAKARRARKPDQRPGVRRQRASRKVVDLGAPVEITEGETFVNDDGSTEGRVDVGGMTGTVVDDGYESQRGHVTGVRLDEEFGGGLVFAKDNRLRLQKSFGYSPKYADNYDRTFKQKKASP